MSAKIDILSFEAGLVDDLVEARTTAINHGRGCRRLDNMLAMAQGPAITRPPARWIASSKGNGAARGFRVVYSESVAFLVEFGNLYVRFFTNDGQVLSGGSAYERPSPYATADLWNLQVYNDAGTLYIVDGAHAPYRLVYAGETSWTLEAIPFTWGPFRDPNDTDITITPSGTTGTITLTAGGGTPFVTGAAGHVGVKFLVGHRVSEASLIHTFTGDGTSTTIAVAKDAGWQIKTSGSFNATLYLEKSYDSGANYEIVATYAPDSDTLDNDIGDETYDDAIYRLRLASWVSGSVKVTFTVNAHVAYGYATITAVTSTSLASATVVETLASAAATKIWAFGAWCPLYGYPRAVCVFDNRLGLLASTQDPTTWWLTRPNKYTEMRTDATAASALIFSFTTGRGDPFLWALADQVQVYIGTPSAILQIAAADPTSAISATNKPQINRRIEFGSAAVPPVRALSTVVLVDSSDTRPMKVTYDWEQDILVAPPLTFSCPTIMAAGIKRVVFQRGPVPTLWYLLEDGSLVAMAYEQLFRQELVGCSEITAGGTDAAIEDIEVLPSADGDVLWWLVARTVGGATVRYWEKMDLLDLKAERATARRLDSYLPFEGEAWTEIEALTVNGVTGVITVTCTGHSFETGDNIDLIDVGGMDWLNHQTFLCADAAANTFTIKTTGGSYVDGRIIGTYTSGGHLRQVENTFGGLDHLEGESVYAVADGAVLGPYIVTSGVVTLPHYYCNVYIGLDYDAWLQPLRIVLPMADGSSRGRQMNVQGLWLSVRRSWEPLVGPDEDHLEKVPEFFTASATPGEAPELVTGDFWVTLCGGLTADPTVLIKAPRGLPLCVRCLMLDAGLGGSRGGKL